MTALALMLSATAAVADGRTRGEVRGRFLRYFEVEHGGRGHLAVEVRPDGAEGSQRFLVPMWRKQGGKWHWNREAAGLLLRLKEGQTVEIGWLHHDGQRWAMSMEPVGDQRREGKDRLRRKREDREARRRERAEGESERARREKGRRGGEGDKGPEEGSPHSREREEARREQAERRDEARERKREGEGDRAREGKGRGKKGRDRAKAREARRDGDEAREGDAGRSREDDEAPVKLSQEAKAQYHGQIQALLEENAQLREALEQLSTRVAEQERELAELVNLVRKLREDE
jgi:hypothetical protein